MSNRLKREKEFHNKAFSEETRSKVDKYYSIHINSQKALFSLLEEHARDKQVLEYGCGPGHNAFFLARHARNLVAIDISDYAIKTAAEHARKEGLTNVQFIEMNAEELEFENETFDLIFGNSILHHLNVEQSYNEIIRVLKPGGRAIFYEPLGHNYFINLFRKLTPQMRTEDEHPLKMHDIKLAEKYFKNVRVQYFHLSTLLAVPFRNTFFFKPLHKTLAGIDNTLFFLLPFLRKQAWFCIMEMQKQP
jgi:ubiquinone/menaquinone biosynthesis C-methylase UbiE